MLTNIQVDIPQTVLQKYTQTEVTNLVNQYVHSLEENDEIESPVLLHQVDYEDLPKEVQQTFDKYEGYTVEDLKNA